MRSGLSDPSLTNTSQSMKKSYCTTQMLLLTVQLYPFSLKLVCAGWWGVGTSVVHLLVVKRRMTAKEEKEKRVILMGVAHISSELHLWIMRLRLLLR